MLCSSFCVPNTRTPQFPLCCAWSQLVLCLLNDSCHAQMFTSLRFLRSLRIIHCDMKPENILLKQSNKSGIKLIDFGSSCLENETVYTYIQSRFYRAPEVILGLPYGHPIDVWSTACILAELFTGYPLFPGENETEQLLCIMEIMGPPPDHLVMACTRKKTFFEADGSPRIVANSRGKKRRPGSKVHTHTHTPAFPPSISKRLAHWL